MSILARPLLRNPTVRLLLCGLAVTLFSSILTFKVYHQGLLLWPPQVAADTGGYTFYAAHVLSGQPYSEAISNLYFFRSWGYPWVLWMTSLRGAVAGHPSPPAPIKSFAHLNWTLKNDLHRGLVRLQASLFPVLALAAFGLAFLVTRSLWISTLTALWISVFPDPLLWARWVLPDSPTCVVNLLCLLALAAAVYSKRIYLAVILALLAGLLAAFNTVMRANFQIVIPVVWIAVVLSICIAGISTRSFWNEKTRRILLVAVLATLPYLVVIRLTVASKQRYAEAGILSDGFARMGAINAAKYYPELDSATLTPAEARVREHLMSLPPPPTDPHLAWDVLFNYMNRHAAAVKLSPLEFRRTLASLNFKAMRSVPLKWSRERFWPAWKEETTAWVLDRDIFREPQFRDSAAGSILWNAARARQFRSRYLDPTLLLIVAALYLLFRFRKDSHALTIILMLIGVHLASLCVGCLLGIPARGRYRFTTEPAAMIVCSVALLHAIGWIIRKLTRREGNV